MSFFRYAESPVVVTNVGTLELYFTFVGTFITGNTLSFSLLGMLLQHLKDMVLIMQTCTGQQDSPFFIPRWPDYKLPLIVDRVVSSVLMEPAVVRLRPPTSSGTFCLFIGGSSFIFKLQLFILHLSIYIAFSNNCCIRNKIEKKLKTIYMYLCIYVEDTPKNNHNKIMKHQIWSKKVTHKFTKNTLFLIINISRQRRILSN